MVTRGSGREAILQRVVASAALVALAATSGVTVLAVVAMTALAWAAVRLGRREAMAQLGLVCLVAGVAAYAGRGPYPIDASGPSRTVVELIAFLACACGTTAAISLTVEQLVRSDRRAAWNARTVELMLDTSVGMVFIATDTRGLVTHYNSGASDALGYAPEEIIGRSAAVLRTDADVARAAEHYGVPADRRAVAIAQEAAGETLEWEMRHQNGSLRLASVRITRMYDDAGETIGFIATGLNLSDRRRTEAALRAAEEHERVSERLRDEAEELKEELVSTVSHELRTPLTSIAGYIELLVTGDLGRLTREQDSVLQRIQRNTGRLEQLVGDLLTLARERDPAGQASYALLDLRSVVEEVAALTADRARRLEVAVSLDLPPEPVPTYGDVYSLEQVVTNLLSNSIKFTPPGGQVRISLEAGRTQSRLVISDSGIGIPESEQDRVFARFFRATSAGQMAVQGSGLGLAIVRAIVTQHGGSVDLESDEGRGTTVRVVLPLDHEVTDGGLPGAVRRTSSLVRVVIADDHELTSASLARTLNADPGIEVVGVARSLERAGELVRAGEPTVLLVERHLPDGDAVPALGELRELGPTMRILVTCSVDDEELRRAALAAGAAGLVSRERSFEDIVAAVRIEALRHELLVRRAMVDARPADDAGAGHLGVTAPELEVLALMAEGLTDAEVARRLSTSEATARRLISSLYAKLRTDAGPRET